MRTNKLFKKINSKSDLIKLRYKDIVIGDLVYDTYLRFNRVATVDINDKKLKLIIRNAINIYESCNLFLKENKIDIYFSKQASYIHYGIMLRLCFEKKNKNIHF